jgi:peroxiredoxin
MSALQPGTPAPNFTLPASPDRKISLADYRGKNVVLVFYPADWSPVCGGELALYTELKNEFDSLNTQVLGISVDGPWSHQAFSQARNYQVPLLADFEPKGEVAKAYGVYRPQDGHTERALFVIDKNGIIRWSYVSPLGVNPGARDVLKALEDLRTWNNNASIQERPI